MTGALLIDVDSTIPNLALMHISTWRKSEGIPTGFHIQNPTEVWASVVFSWNRHKVDGLEFMFPGAKIDVGGGGKNLQKRLPEEVDRMMPDYSLYPKMDFDLGFTTRGCNRRCGFCIVPSKEGIFRINQHPAEFHDPRHRKVMLLDNNILADRSWFFEVTDWIMAKGMKVDFDQGLDIRLMDPGIARRLAELRPMTYWRFAFDSLSYKKEVEDGIRMLDSAGVNVRNRCGFYVYVDGDDDYDSAMERCRILRRNNTLPFLMLNREAPRTQRITDMKRWTRPWIFFSTDFENYERGMKTGMKPLRTKNKEMME